MLIVIMLIALMGQANPNQVTLECKNCIFGEASERRIYIEQGTQGKVRSTKKRVVHRRKRKVSLPLCTPNYGDPLPYKGTVTPYQTLEDNKMLFPEAKGIGRLSIPAPKPENDLLLRFPVTEPQPLDIKEGSIGKSLALTGIYLNGIVIPFNGWEGNPSVKGGDYVLVSKDDLQKLMKTDIFIKLFQGK